ncbi:hypothetical protein T12_14690, partial [Trichinella patagoniensis]
LATPAPWIPWCHIDPKLIKQDVLDEQQQGH